MEIREQEGEVKTTSRLRVWLLTTFKGYKVKLRITSSPKFTIFRTVAYKNTWVLQPPDDGTETG